MKRLLFGLLFCLSICKIWSQNTIIKHIVQRGETSETIAKSYGISEEQLKELNPFCDKCYVGLSLSVLQNNINTPAGKIENSMPEKWRNEYENAVLLATSGKYKEATKVYDKLITEFPNGELYFNRGVCQYERGKWKRAIRDLEMALVSKELSEVDYSKAEEYLQKAREERSAQQMRNAEAWGSLAATAIIATTAIVTAKNNNKNQKSSTSSKGVNDNSLDLSSSEDISENTVETKTASKKECPICHGEGTIIEYTATFGIVKDEYCEECGKVVPNGHYHKKCSYCDGKGYR